MVEEPRDLGLGPRSGGPWLWVLVPLRGCTREAGPGSVSKIWRMESTAVSSVKGS